MFLAMSILWWIRQPFSRAPHMLAPGGNGINLIISYALSRSPARLRRSTMQTKWSLLGSIPKSLMELKNSIPSFTQPA
uniref:Uncharacterized protein n=1 Tax=Cucumis melo TaxID=3656 RepID=A0A9I9E8X4_CUCME